MSEELDNLINLRNEMKERMEDLYCQIDKCKGEICDLEREISVVTCDITDIKKTIKPSPDDFEKIIKFYEIVKEFTLISLKTSCNCNQRQYVYLSLGNNMFGEEYIDLELDGFFSHKDLPIPDKPLQELLYKYCVTYVYKRGNLGRTIFSMHREEIIDETWINYSNNESSDEGDEFIYNKCEDSYKLITL